ncbi:MAG: EamA family transporter RarD [Desulfobacteraceae bacterium]|jgi:chloramphenicol-sensitive protein RarD
MQPQINDHSATTGVMLALGAFLIWGMSPIYFKSLLGIPAHEILLHRMVWSFLLLLPIVVFTRRSHEFKTVLLDRRKLFVLAITTILVSGNWFVFIWAVQNNRIVEASLGYYINPLLNVLLGIVVLKERLRWPQIIAVSLAAMGVVYLTVQIGTLPWISLVLAFSFACYGLIRKVAPVNALVGLTVETLFLSVPAAIYLVFIGMDGRGAYLHLHWTTDILLMCAGLITAIPLLLFTAGARKIHLSTLGILQYFAPSCNFLIALVIYHESMLPAQWMTFFMIWTALIIYTLDMVRANKKQRIIGSLNKPLRSRKALRNPAGGG